MNAANNEAAAPGTDNGSYQNLQLNYSQRAVESQVYPPALPRGQQDSQDSRARKIEEIRAETAAQVQDEKEKYGSESNIDKNEADQGHRPPLTRADLAPIKSWIIEAPPVIEFILRPFLPKGVVGLMTGPGGIGKSNLTLLMTISAAVGKDIPPFKATTPQKTLLLNVEDSGNDIRRRLHTLAHSLGLSPNEIDLLDKNLMIYPGRGQVGPLMRKEGQNPEMSEDGAWIEDSIKNLQPSFVILDPKSRLYGLDENSNDECAQWLNLLEKISEETGSTILIIHHVSKAMANESNQLASRGASSLVDNCRTVLSLTGLSDNETKKFDLSFPQKYFKLENVKANYSESGNVFYFKKGEHGVPDLVDLEAGRLAAAADLLYRKLKLLENRFTRRELRDRGDDSAKKIRKRLKEEHGVSKRDIDGLIDILLEDGRVTIESLIVYGQTREEIHIL